MKLLFLSDIHGIPKNLSKVEEIIKQQKIDKLIVLGDLYYAGPSYCQTEVVDSSAVKSFLMNYQDSILCMRGNCDSDVDVKVSDFPICESLSLIHVDNLDIYCTHGNEYNIDKTSKFNRKGVLVYGHEHTPYIKKKYDMIYINTGSISLPRNNSEPSYLIYENRTFTLYTIGNEIIDCITL